MAPILARRSPAIDGEQQRGREARNSGHASAELCRAGSSRVDSRSPSRRSSIRSTRWSVRLPSPAARSIRCSSSSDRGQGDASFALGHEAVAEVVAIGDEVHGLRGRPARPPVVPGFVRGLPRRVAPGTPRLCDEYPVLSDYGMQPLSGIEFGGMLSDVVRVPHAPSMLFPLPYGLDPVSLASVPDNVVDGYRGVAPHLKANPDADVLVAIHGTPSIGLYAAQCALALGAPQRHGRQRRRPRPRPRRGPRREDDEDRLRAPRRPVPTRRRLRRRTRRACCTRSPRPSPRASARASRTTRVRRRRCRSAGCTRSA